MGEVINAYTDGSLDAVSNENGLVEIAEGMLADARAEIHSGTTVSLPIAELSTLGAGVSSLIPAFNTVTQTSTIAMDGLYRVANMAAGDSLKMLKNSDLAWGAMKTADGGSKMVKLAQAGPVSQTVETVAAVNPATIMMAAALYSIEKELKEISATQKEILSFLENEKHSEIESDVESLLSMVTNYKYHWNNEIEVSNYHNKALDYQSNARTNMIYYQKSVAEQVSSKRLIVVQKDAKATLARLQKEFKYYRLSLYTYALASLMEVMYSSNYSNEAYVQQIRDDIEDRSLAYRQHFERASRYIESLGNSSVEKNVVKGIGTAGKTVGKLIGGLPAAKVGKVELSLQDGGELLQDRGNQLQRNARRLVQNSIREFASVSDPGTGVFVRKMDDMIRIYNHTTQIYADKERIYLVG